MICPDCNGIGYRYDPTQRPADVRCLACLASGLVTEGHRLFVPSPEATEEFRRRCITERLQPAGAPRETERHHFMTVIPGERLPILSYTTTAKAAAEDAAGAHGLHQLPPGSIVSRITQTEEVYRT